MSKRIAGGFRGFEFWVYDVCQALLWAEMAGVLENLPPRARSEWTADLDERLRVHAAIADLYVSLDEWTDGHEEEFVELVAQARDRLTERGTVTPQEAAEWIVLDGLPIGWRGSEPVGTGPAVEFADAVIGIIRGTYPPAPPGRRWYFGSHRPNGETATIGTGE
jgi:hypothetical protein